MKTLTRILIKMMPRGNGSTALSNFTFGFNRLAGGRLLPLFKSRSTGVSNLRTLQHGQETKLSVVLAVMLKKAKTAVPQAVKEPVEEGLICGYFTFNTTIYLLLGGCTVVVLFLPVIVGPVSKAATLAINIKAANALKLAVVKAVSAAKAASLAGSPHTMALINQVYAAKQALATFIAAKGLVPAVIVPNSSIVPVGKFVWSLGAGILGLALKPFYTKPAVITGSGREAVERALSSDAARTACEQAEIAGGITHEALVNNTVTMLTKVETVLGRKVCPTAPYSETAWASLEFLQDHLQNLGVASAQELMLLNAEFPLVVHAILHPAGLF